MITETKPTTPQTDLIDVRVKRGADINSDHRLLIKELRMRLEVMKKSANKVL